MISFCIKWKLGEKTESHLAPGLFSWTFPFDAKTYHVIVLLQKTHLVNKTKWLYQNLTSMHQNFLWWCHFTAAATRMLHNFVFLCILYRCLKSSRITTCDLGKEIVMNDILSWNSKMILSCKSCLLHRAWATGYKIHWEENVIFL